MRTPRSFPELVLVATVALGATSCSASDATATATETSAVSQAETTATTATTTEVVETTTTTFEFYTDPVLVDIAAMFDEYAELINSGREGEAYDRFAGPGLRSRITRDDFIEGNSTSSIHDLIAYRAFWLDTEAPLTNAEAWVTFISFQGAEFGHDGQTCTVWDLTYTMLHTDEGWKIQAATNGPDSPTAC